MMRTLKVTAATAALAFGLTACGGGAPDPDTLAEDFVDFATTQVGEEVDIDGLDEFFDKDCIAKNLEQLSDEDLQTIEDGLAELKDDPDAEPSDISDEGGEVMDGAMSDCFDQEGLQKKVAEEQGTQ